MIRPSPYRVGWFKDYFGGPAVRRLIEGAGAISAAEKHPGFLGWCAPTVYEDALQPDDDGDNWMRHVEDVIEERRVFVIPRSEEEGESDLKNIDESLELLDRLMVGFPQGKELFERLKLYWLHKRTELIRKIGGNHADQV